MVQDTGKQAFSSAAEENACLIKNGAGEGNRTLVTSLEGWRSTIELHPQWSGQPDSNWRPPAPKAGALPTALCPAVLIILIHLPFEVNLFSSFHGIFFYTFYVLRLRL